MYIDIVKIGNSKGIRLPTYVLKECNIKDQVEIEVVDGKIVIQAVDVPRKNWDQKFETMHEREDDVLLIHEELDMYAEDWKW